MKSHVVIAGGSISGKLAAMVTAKYYDKVTIIEPDAQIKANKPRSGVPQSNHFHAFWIPGMDNVEKIVSGFSCDAIDSGLKRINLLQDMSGTAFGINLINFDDTLEASLMDRPKFEYALQQFVEKLDNVEILMGYKVVEYQKKDDANAITGVKIKSIQGDELKCLDANLVIDACGRASITPRALKKIGFRAPNELTTNAKLTTCSRWYQIDPELKLPWELLYLSLEPPDTKVATIARISDDRIVATFGDALGGELYTDNANFLKNNENLHCKLTDAVLDNLKKPICDVDYMTVPNIYLRQYHELDSMPKGLIVIGDAFSFLHPFFGQGITKITYDALILDDLLKNLRGDDLIKKPFENKFHKLCAKKHIIPLYEMNSSFFFNYDTVTGDAPEDIEFKLWYSKQLIQLINQQKDTDIVKLLFEVHVTMKEQNELLSNEVLIKVLRMLSEQSSRGH